MTNFNWTDTDGDWEQPNSWLNQTTGTTGAGVPAVGDAAEIDTATVTISSAESIEVGTLAIGAVSPADIGTLSVDGTLQVDSGLTLNGGDITLGGTIAGTTIVANSGSITYNLGTFSDVTFKGTLDLGDNGLLQIANGLKVTDATGTLPGVVNITGGGAAALIFTDDETIDNVTINVGSDTGFNALNANGASLELGAGVTINSVGVNGLQLGGGAVVTSKGVINLGVAGGQASLASTSFINAGALNVTNGQTLSIGTGDFGNTGTFFIDSASEVDFAGSAIDATQTVGGTVEIDGTLNANGSTIDLGPTSAFANTTLLGTLSNAVVVSDGGTINYQLGTLLADTFDGTLDLGDNGLVTVLGGITVNDATGTLPGVINITGGGAAALIIGDSETIDNVTINVGSSTGYDALNANGASLELGAGVTINSVGINGLQLGGAAVVTSKGVVNLGVAGGQASLASTSFINAGALNVTNGQTLSIGTGDFGNTGSFVIDSASEVDFAGSTIDATQTVGGTVEIDGTLNANGSTIDLGPTSAFANTTLLGTLSNAVIVSAGGTINYQLGTLLADTFDGTLDLGDNGLVTVLGGLTVNNAGVTGPGVINVTGSGAAALIIGDAETLDNVTINVGSNTGYDALNANGASFVLGSHVTVNSVGANGLQLGGAAAVTNRGAIKAAVAGGQSAIDTGSFANAGTIAVSNKQVLSITSEDGTVANTGLLSVATNGSIDVTSALGGVGRAAVGLRSTLEIGGAVSAGQTITFAAGLATVKLDDAAETKALFRGFASSDHIDLVGLNPILGKVASYNSGVVHITGGASAIDLKIPGNPAGSGFALLSDGQGGSNLITGRIINGPAGGHGNISVPMTNAIINAQGYGNTITIGSCDAVINAGSGGAVVKAGISAIAVKLSGSKNLVTASHGTDLVYGNASFSAVSLGGGNDVVNLTGSFDAVQTGGGNSTITLTGNYDAVRVGNGQNTISVAGTSDIVSLAGGSALVSASGSKNVVFLGSSSSTVNDLGKSLNVVAGPNAGASIIGGVASDPSFVLDLVGGAGGYTSAAKAYAALTSDGHGGSMLAIGTTGSVDFAGVQASQLSAHNFAVLHSFG